MELSQHAAPVRGEGLGTKAVPGCNGIQLKKGKLKMAIRDNFLTERAVGIREWLPQGQAGSSLAQDTGNRMEHDSSSPAEGSNPALTEDELDNLQGLFYLEVLGLQ